MIIYKLKISETVKICGYKERDNTTGRFVKSNKKTV